MKNILKTGIFVVFATLLVACASGIYKKNALKEMSQQVEEKITQMQDLIKFSDEQAFKLKKVELDYLKGIEEIKICENCNKEELLQRLQNKREIQLQNILERHQYIKYNAIENDRIKQIDLIAK